MNREKGIKPSVARMMYQIDWMTTDEEPDPYRDDIENNKDYQNYLNGKYNFDTPELQSLYKYLDKYCEIGTEIELDFGWKTNYDITNWFSMPVGMAYCSAPLDIDAFSQACVAAIQNFHDRGYGDSIKYLSFYNEPNHLAGDFITVGESEPWYIKMTLSVCEALEKAGLRDKIEVWGPEQGQATISYHNYLRKFSADERIQEKVDSLCFHRYFKPDFENNYYELFHDIVYFNNEFGKRAAITEMVAADTQSGAIPQTDSYFQDSYTAYIVAAANAGARGVLSWGFAEQYCVAPLSFWQGAYAHFATKTSVENLKPVDKSYAECALITNYVDAHSQVLMSDWEGDDIKLTTFKNPDGEYTILLETDKSESDYELDIYFEAAVNKTFYRIAYNRSKVPTASYTIPTYDKTFNVTNRISDTLPKGEAMYIYTTKAPLKQIELNEYGVMISAYETFDFDAALIDCDDEIVWSVSAATGSEGTINSNGVYTPAWDAEAGDFVAIRAALKSDPNVFTTAMIEITE